MPKEEKKEKKIFSSDDIAELWKHDDNPACKIILILIYTGFRINELFQIPRTDVHIEDGYIVGGEKTEAGKDRIVPINPKIAPLIEWWMNRTVTVRERTPGGRVIKREAVPGYLISNAKGGPKDDKNFRDREFYPKLIELGIIPEFRKGYPDENGNIIEEKVPPALKPHCTRHTFASLGAKAGIKPEVLQKLIGHAKYATTAEIYIHSDIEQLKEAMKSI